MTGRRAKGERVGRSGHRRLARRGTAAVASLIPGEQRARAYPPGLDRPRTKIPRALAMRLPAVRRAPSPSPVAVARRLCPSPSPVRPFLPSARSTSRSNCTDRLSRLEYGPGWYARDCTPSWLCSQMCQSCRLVMSQNSTPSSGLKAGIAQGVGMEEPGAEDPGAVRCPRARGCGTSRSRGAGSAACWGRWRSSTPGSGPPPAGRPP